MKPTSKRLEILCMYISLAFIPIVLLLEHYWVTNSHGPDTLLEVKGWGHPRQIPGVTFFEQTILYKNCLSKFFKLLVSG